MMMLSYAIYGLGLAVGIWWIKSLNKRVLYLFLAIMWIGVAVSTLMSIR